MQLYWVIFLSFFLSKSDNVWWRNQKIWKRNKKIEEKAIKAIKNAASTGEIGDGKIFSLNINKAIRIRTGEKGTNAL